MPFRILDEPEQVEESPSPQKTSPKFRIVEEEKPSKTRSLLSAAPKGFIKELREQLLNTPILGKGLKQLQKETPDLVKSEEDVQEFIDKFLPTNEGFGEEALERGGRILPYAAAGGGNLGGQALRSALAGFLGQGAEEAGLPPWAQALAELPAFASPNLGKKISPNAKQKELVEGARKLGLSEQEITPLIQSEKKQKYLGKIAPRRGRTKKLLDKSYKALGNVYDRLETSPVGKAELSPEASRSVLDSIHDELGNMPNELRKLIKDDVMELSSGLISGSALINLFKDLNYNIGKGHSRLGTLKEPIFKALESISPEFANDFRLTNKLYGNYAQISQKLKPTLVSDLCGAGEAIRLLTGLSLGNFPLLGELVSEQTARLLSRELLLNPRLQNISKKMMNALNQNKFSAANQFLKEYTKEIEELNPEIGEKLKTIDFTTQLNKHKK